ncbi:MAG: alcohol dehydrogenase catalytic domain-containing protein [Clostridia bacterium]|jgi:L-iditol 2-dehydrogenase|nr:alcohol dehydrogenase catalytic domain-containing protein [Clostridia bacterium]MBT7121834.1 alcohol dehydrogenase catalytic domain-containing protein [Clostridia bacterium]
MKAAYYYGKQDIRIEEVPLPQIGDSDMLIKVKATAVCGTDLRIFKFGHFKIPEGDKRVLGHEIAGEIVKIGKNVKGYELGDRIATPPNIGCGHCTWCIKGLNQLCPDYEAFGISIDGGFAEYMRVPSDAIDRGNAILIPDSLSYEQAALCEPLSCTYNAYESVNTAPGDTVLIIGAGPIGACHVMINKMAGAGKIIVADISDARLKQIKQFGVDVTINSAETDLKTAVMRETDGIGCDVVITACSVPEIQTLSLELAARCGRINLFGGMPKGKEIVPLNTNLIHYNELQVVATTGSSIEDFYQAMRIAASGKINLGALATARFNIDDIIQAFDYALCGQGMKALIIMD